MSFAAVRETVAGWSPFGWVSPKRAATTPIQFTPPFSNHYGGGLGTKQPSEDLLLQECRGISATARGLISRRLSSLQPMVKVKRRGRDGSTTLELIADHPLIDMLDEPHDDFTTSQTLKLWGDWLVTVGQFYALKIRNGLNVPAQLQPMPPGNVRPVVSQGVITHYIVRDGRGVDRSYDRDMVVRGHIPDPESPYEPIGVLGPVGLDADSMKFASQHLRTHFQNDAMPRTLIKPGEDPQLMDPDAKKRFYADWVQNYHQRLGRQVGLPGMLPMNWDIVELAMQSGADVVPLLVFWRDQILMAFGVSKSLLGMAQVGDRSTAEAMLYTFDLHTVTPYAKLISDALTKLAKDFDRKLVVVFKEFVARDKEFELKQETADLSSKVVSINEVRERRGLEPVDWGNEPVGNFADVPYRPDDRFELEMDDPAALGDRGREATAPIPCHQRAEPTMFARAEWERQLSHERKYVPIYKKELERLFKKQRIETLKRLFAAVPRSRVSGAQIFDPTEWIGDFETRLGPIQTASFSEAGATTLAAIGDQTFIFSEAMREALARQTTELAEHVGATTAKRINRQLTLGTEAGEGVEQLASRVLSVFSDRSQKQSRTIARTEIGKASTNAQLEGYEQSGVVEKKQWNTALDGEVRDDHIALEGVAVGVAEGFDLGGELASGPRTSLGGGSLSAAQTINCRCFLTPVIEE